MKTVNEQSPLFVTVVFTDKDGDPLVPASVDWRVDDITNDAQVTDWASISPLATVEITIPGTSNIIDDDTNVREVQVITVRVDDGLAGEAHQKLNYKVMNLAGTSGA